MEAFKTVSTIIQQPLPNIQYYVRVLMGVRLLEDPRNAESS